MPSWLTQTQDILTHRVYEVGDRAAAVFSRLSFKHVSLFHASVLFVAVTESVGEVLLPFLFLHQAATPPVLQPLPSSQSCPSPPREHSAAASHRCLPSTFRFHLPSFPLASARLPRWVCRGRSPAMLSRRRSPGRGRRCPGPSPRADPGVRSLAPASRTTAWPPWPRCPSSSVARCRASACAPSWPRAGPQLLWRCPSAPVRLRRVAQSGTPCATSGAARPLPCRGSCTGNHRRRRLWTVRVRGGCSAGPARPCCSRPRVRPEPLMPRAPSCEITAAGQLLIWPALCFPCRCSALEPPSCAGLCSAHGSVAHRAGSDFRFTGPRASPARPSCSAPPGPPVRLAGPLATRCLGLGPTRAAGLLQAGTGPLAPARAWSAWACLLGRSVGRAASAGPPVPGPAVCRFCWAARASVRRGLNRVAGTATAPEPRGARIPALGRWAE